MSQQRVHVPDASLPSPGSARAFVPPLQRYYQGTATSCRSSRRVSFPSFGGATGSRIFRSRHRCVRQLRAWGWSPGIPFRAFFRGNDRISQVPGEPQFPFAHVLRPRPAETPLTDGGMLAWPSLSARRRRRQEQNFRGSMAWLSGLPPTYHDVGCPSPRKTGFHVLVRLSWTGFYPQSSYKRFSTHFIVRCPPFPSFLAQPTYHGWVTLPRARLASRCWSGSPGWAFTHRVPIKGFNSLHVGYPPLPSFLAQSGLKYQLSIFPFAFALTLESQGKLVYNRENVLPVLLDLPGFHGRCWHSSF